MLFGLSTRNTADPRPETASACSGTVWAACLLGIPCPLTDPLSRS
jgi:hypothetical protein